MEVSNNIVSIVNAAHSQVNAHTPMQHTFKQLNLASLGKKIGVRIQEEVKQTSKGRAQKMFCKKEECL